MTGSPLQPFLDERDRLAASTWSLGDERRLPELLDAAITSFAGPMPPGYAVAAIGGYGRQVMALHSDVDLLFLHPEDSDGDIEQRVLRPLWDARLKVGHLSNTPRAARLFAGTRLDAISTFLTARLLTGDEDTFDEFWKLFVGLLEKEHAQIVSMLAAEERTRRSEEPRRLMAADLKVGRGGMRTIDLLDWRSRLFELQSAPTAAPEPERELRMELTRIRSALHAASGRLYDRYDFELREPASRYLGADVATLGRRVLELRRRAEQLVDEQWPEIRAGRMSEPPDRPITAADLTNRHLMTESAFDTFITRAVPSWRRLQDTPHIVPFHAYGVADHSLACVDEMTRLTTDPDDGLAAEIMSDFGDTEPLTWAALLHDVGKGTHGPHGRTGARMVRDEVRIDLPERGLIERLVEHHLLLADLATRYDLDDPGVVSWVADRIPDGRTLGSLYLLTVADSRATGTDTWSAWRAELVRRAYRRLERELRRRSMPEELQVEILADRVLAVGSDLTRGEVETHLSGFGRMYRSSHSPEEIVAHMRLARRPLDVGGVTVETTPGNPASMIVTTIDRPRLLIAVAGTLALNRISILDARFATRTDGRVFDTFGIVADDGHDLENDELSGIARSVAESVRRGSDLGPAVLSKQRAYRDTSRAGIEPVVEIEPSGVGGGMITVEAADRLGLVHDLGLVFERYGMPITRARVDTRAGVAYDVFWVDRLPADRRPLEADLESALDAGSET